MLNWWKLHEENDFKWLLKDSNKSVNEFAEKIFKSIKSEFVEEFGIDKKYSKYLDKVWKLESILIDMALTGDRSKKIFADILELEIEDLLSEQEIKIHNHGMTQVEKHMGFKLNKKTTTVMDFYGYVKDIEEQLKQIK